MNRIMQSAYGSGVMLLALVMGCNLTLSPDEGGQIVSASGGMDCAEATCAFEIPAEGIIETFTAVPDEGYEFTGWGIPCQKNSTNECVVDLSSRDAAIDYSHNLEAHFKAVTASYEGTYIISNSSEGDSFVVDRDNHLIWIVSGGGRINILEGDVYPNGTFSIEYAGNTISGTISLDGTLTGSVIGPFASVFTGQIDNWVTSNSYNALFAGHSYFDPIAISMQAHAHQAGFTSHTQQNIFRGGRGGSARGLWEDLDSRKEMQDILDTGEVDLFGMTVHDDDPAIANEAYRKWIDYAVEKNPNVAIFIALSWFPYPGSVDSLTYAAEWEALHPSVHDSIDFLRAEFPNNNIYCIPYGWAATELYKRFESGDLPDVQRLVSTNQTAGIFGDDHGHPDLILIRLSQLIWLNAIYGVDLNNYDYDAGYSSDLKAIAQDIMDGHDPRYDSAAFR